MGITDHLTCLLRNMYAGQEVTVRKGYGAMDWLQIGKRVHKGCILSPCLFNFMQSTWCEMPGWMKHKQESRLPGEISITSDMQMTPALLQKEEELTEPLDESERGEWKIWLKAQHSENEDHVNWFHHFLANRWENSGNSGRLYFLQMVTCSHEIKRRLLLGRKVMTNLDSILKSRDMTLPTKSV